MNTCRASIAVLLATALAMGLLMPGSAAAAARRSTSRPPAHPIAHPAAPASDPAANAAKLEQLRAKLAQLEHAQQTATDQRGEVTRTLKDDERRSATAAAKLHEAEAELAHQQNAYDALQRDQQAQRDLLKRQRGALSAQVRSAFVAGRQERLKLLLNLEDPSRVGRMLAYFERFNSARATRISEVTAVLTRLTQLGREMEDQLAVLNGVRKARSSALTELDTARSARHSTLTRLDAEIRQRGGELKRVASETERLRQLLESIGDVFADAPFDAGAGKPFAQLRGRLPWPLRGRVLASYGQTRAGSRLKWEGLLIESATGAPVRAVAAGRIAYADWLPFYGMIVILEHGDGYMSLYGHNQSLAKAAGEWVQRGEVIAQSGDSGGQNRSALYFEVRKGKEPQDPRRWLARR